MGDFRRWVMFEDTVSIEIVVRKLQKNYAIEVCRYSLKFCKKNVTVVWGARGGHGPPRNFLVNSGGCMGGQRGPRPPRNFLGPFGAPPFF